MLLHCEEQRFRHQVEILVRENVGPCSFKGPEDRGPEEEGQTG